MLELLRLSPEAPLRLPYDPHTSTPASTPKLWNFQSWALIRLLGGDPAGEHSDIVDISLSEDIQSGRVGGEAESRQTNALKKPVWRGLMRRILTWGRGTCICNISCWRIDHNAFSYFSYSEVGLARRPGFTQTIKGNRLDRVRGRKTLRQVMDGCISRNFGKSQRNVAKTRKAKGEIEGSRVFHVIDSDRSGDVLRDLQEERVSVTLQKATRARQRLMQTTTSAAANVQWKSRKETHLCSLLCCRPSRKSVTSSTTRGEASRRRGVMARGDKYTTLPNLSRQAASREPA